MRLENEGQNGRLYEGSKFKMQSEPLTPRGGSHTLLLFVANRRLEFAKRHLEQLELLATVLEM